MLGEDIKQKDLEAPRAARHGITWVHARSPPRGYVRCFLRLEINKHVLNAFWLGLRALSRGEPISRYFDC